MHVLESRQIILIDRTETIKRLWRRHRGTANAREGNPILSILLVEDGEELDRIDYGIVEYGGAIVVEAEGVVVETLHSSSDHSGSSSSTK